MSESRKSTREDISLLIVSVIGTIALTEGIIAFQKIISSPNYRILSEPTAYFLIFLSVWYRFIPGNIAHIRTLERHPTITINVWLLDLSIIMLESMILTFMAELAAKGSFIFLIILAILLLLDIIWGIIIFWGAKKGIRPGPEFLWLILNIPSFVLVLISIVRPRIGDGDIFGPGSYYSLIVLPLFFIAMAFIDIKLSGPEWFGRHVSAKTPQKYIDKFMQMAIEEAKKSLKEGGIPIGAVLVRDETLLGAGHNRRVQDGNPIAHAEIECLKNAGRIANYKGTTLYSTLMPCIMCAGAIVQFGIKKVVVGESRNYAGAKTFLEDCGVEVIGIDNETCRKMLEDYIKKNPSIWKEDIGKL